MNVSEFLDTVDTAELQPVYLFCPHKPPRARNASFEPLLAQRAVERCISRLVEPSMRDLSLTQYYADETAPAEVVDAAQTMPFLTERRVVVVHQAECYESESAGGPLLDYLASPNESTVLLLVASSMDKRSKLYKACQKTATMVECPELSEREAAGWVRLETDTKGKTISSSAAQYLVQRTGTGLGELANAIELVCNYVGDKAAIEENDITEACADVAEEEVWALTGAVERSDMNAAVRVLREILALGKNEFEILGTINWLLKSAHAVASGDKVSPWQAKRVGPLADKLGPQKIRDAFRLCIETDVMFRTTGVDRSLALELLVIKLAAPRPGRRARR